MSYNLICPISGLSITASDEVMYFLLIPNYSAKRALELTGSLVSNDGLYQFFYPMAMPFVGKYDGEGGVEDIVKDNNTELIEKYFNIKLETVVAYMLNKEAGELNVELRKDWKKVNKKEQLTKGGIMLVRKDIYDHLSVKSTTYGSSYNKNFDALHKRAISKYSGRSNSTNELVQLVRQYSTSAIWNDQHLFITPYNSNTEINNIYLQDIATKSVEEISPIKAIFVNYCNFVDHVIELRLLFFPNIYGSSHLNFKAKLNLNKKINQIIKQQLKKFDLV